MTELAAGRTGSVSTPDDDREFAKDENVKKAAARVKDADAKLRDARQKHREAIAKAREKSKTP